MNKEEIIISILIILKKRVFFKRKYFVLSLNEIEIGLVVPEKTISKFPQCTFVTRNYSPLKTAWPFIWIPMMFCAKCDWNWPRTTGNNDFYMLSMFLRYIVIISPRKIAWSFIWKKSWIPLLLNFVTLECVNFTDKMTTDQRSSRDFSSGELKWKWNITISFTKESSETFRWNFPCRHFSSSLCFPEPQSKFQLVFFSLL